MAFPWPPVDEEVQAAVLAQLRDCVSVPDGSGIVARFEAAFAARHRARYALLTSSGTAALHSAYYALGIGPGDEVIVQDYTWPATAMPLFQLGALPVLADVDRRGELDLDQAAGLVTGKTRAVAVTHMWGNPQDMRRLRAWCDDRGLALVEDCSHAHGASRDGVSAGELADAACWSLQRLKLVTAGEGGILTTQRHDVHQRAVLLGHPRRTPAGIAGPSPLDRYAETGLGHSYRAHPLGLAMAEVYLRRLDGWLAQRRRYAAMLAQALAGVPGVWIHTRAAPDRTVTFHLFVVGVEPAEAGFTRDDLLGAVRGRGCRDAVSLGALRPLHTYPAFIAPRSPVTSYRVPVIRGPLPNSGRLTACGMGIPLPVDDGPTSREYVGTAVAALGAALAEVAGERRAVTGARPV
jgi:dTDP-4-amino-4,6-dideoxygalactose transaminase